ncbi:uncharacterized protein LOC119653412 [Hermetia illucens]|nr:uncharacterized protein LOC119653412 [Hermetia illucens]
MGEPKPHSSKRERPSRLHTFKFTGESFDERLSSSVKNRTPRAFLATPDRLEELAANVVDKMKIPSEIFWTKRCVQNFISTLGFLTYPNAFVENMVTGRALVIVDAAALVKMNIQDFDDIKTITKAVRELYEIENIQYQRCVALPPRYPLTHWKFYVRLTGPKYQNCRPSDLFRKMALINELPKNESHWTQLENYLKHKHRKDIVRVGYTPRYRLYTGDRPYLKKYTRSDTEVECNCMPPCECRWTEPQLRKPWVLSCLSKLNKLEFSGETSIIPTQ